MGDNPKQPLLVPRENLIARLQERKDEAEKKRKEAEDARSEARKAALAAVGTLTADQVANIIQHYVTGDDNAALVKWIEATNEDKKFVTLDLKPTATEDTLEKLVRVLKMATNQEIEVYPSDPLYSYI